MNWQAQMCSTFYRPQVVGSCLQPQHSLQRFQTDDVLQCALEPISPARGAQQALRPHYASWLLKATQQQIESALSIWRTAEQSSTMQGPMLMRLLNSRKSKDGLFPAQCFGQLFDRHSASSKCHIYSYSRVGCLIPSQSAHISDSTQDRWRMFPLWHFPRLWSSGLLQEPRKLSFRIT